MYLMRSCRTGDLEALKHLASLGTLLNLPADHDLLAERIDRSARSFAGDFADAQDTYFTFVLEAPDGQVVGTSAIMGQHGTKDDPHVSFEVLKVEKYSPALDRHFRHQVLKLSFNYEGPTEIASIILDPTHRRSGKQLGRQLSFVRFLYIAARRDRFRKMVIAEMLPPHVSDGWSPLWDSLGKKFTGISYTRADRMSHENKNFIQLLFPHEPIYVCLLPEDAQAVIGAVDPGTIPAVKMLEAVGFRYNRRVDPFDGGPHYSARCDDITVVRDTFTATLSPDNATEKAAKYLVGAEVEGGEFRMVLTPADHDADGATLAVPEAARNRLGLSGGAPVVGYCL